MSKNARKIITVLNLILLVLLISAAIPFIYFARVSFSHTPVAVADEVQPEVDDPEDQRITYIGSAWTPDNIYKESYKFIKFTDNDGQEVTVKYNDGKGHEIEEPGAKDAGEYTVTVTPAENRVWRSDGGTGEKTFQLTIEKAQLEWFYNDSHAPNQQDAKDRNEEAFVRTSFWESPQNNRINNVQAFFSGNSQTYSKKAPVSDPDKRSEYDFEITKEGEDGTRDRDVSDVGTYTFTVANFREKEEKDRTAVAKNFENPSFTLIIEPIRVNIAENNILKWVIDSGRYPDLNLGIAYEYSYNEAGSAEVKKFYSASELTKAPYNNWENWTAVSTSPKTEYNLTAYREGKTNAIKLYRDSGSLAYFNVNKESGYSGNVASQPGRYEATALIEPVANYTLYFDLEAVGKTEADLGMTVEPNDDGTYSVTKVWYVVQYFNEYIDRSSLEDKSKVEYVFPTEWTFGKLPEGGIFAPCIAHGDEILMLGEGGYPQPDGYTLNVDDEIILKFGVPHVVEDEDGEDSERGEDGEQLYNITYFSEGWQDGSKDIVTFTIMRGETEICRNQPRSRFDYYVNEYMPVGKYTITFATKPVSFDGEHVDWWLGNASTCGSSYIGTTISFDFEVKTDTCLYDDLDVNFKNNDQMVPYEVDFGAINGDYNNFFGVTAGKALVEGAVRKQTIAESNTYWATVADDYFDEKPYLTFSLVIEDAEYLPASAGEWAALIAGADTYRIYYQINMRNYESEAVSDGSKYFDIILYEVLEIPEFVIAEYTGEAQAVTPAEEDARYTIEDNVQTAIGSYEATLTLLDNVHYRWKGIEGAVCKVNYIIDKAINSWLTDPNLADYQWNSFDRTVNLVAATPLVSSPVFGVTYDEEGLISVVGLESFTVENGVVSAEAEAVFNTLKAGKYFLWCSAVETDTHKPIEKAAYEFNVELADNGWIAEPDIVSWSDSQTPKLPTATPKYGKVTFKIVSEQDEDEVYFDSENGINRLAGLKAGSYVLIASVAGTNDTYKGIQASKTFLIYSSLNDVVIILLCVLIALLVCAVVALVILMLYYKRKKGGHGGENGSHGGNGGGGHTPEGPHTEHHEADHSEPQQISIMHVLEANGAHEHAHNKENIGEEPAVEESVGEQPEINNDVEVESEEDEPEPVEDESEVEEYEPEVEDIEPEVEPVEEEPVQEEPVYEQPIEQPAEQQPAEQPVYAQPMYDMYGRPMYDMYGRPMYQQPAYNQPAYGQAAQAVEEQPVYEEIEEDPVEDEQTEENLAEEPEVEAVEPEELPVYEETQPVEDLQEEENLAEEPAEESVAEVQPVEEEEEIAPPVFDAPAEEQPASEEPAEQAEEIAPPVFDEPAEEQAPAEQPAEEEPEIAPPVFDEPAEESKPENGEQPDGGEQD